MNTMNGDDRGIVTARVIRVPKNETPEAKLYRVVVATVRVFAREYPAEIMRIVKEEVDGIGLEK